MGTAVVFDGSDVLLAMKFIKERIEREDEEWRSRTSENERLLLLNASKKEMIQSVERMRSAEVRASEIIAKAHENHYAVQVGHMRLLRMCGLVPTNPVW